MKYILLLSLLFSLTSLKAQAPVKEYGIGLANFDQFSLQYRWGNGIKFYRITGNLGAAFSLEDKTSNTGTNTNITTVRQTTPANISLGVGFSILKLKPLNEKIGLMYGINFSVSSSYYESKVYFDPINQTSGSSNKAIQPSLGPVLGGYFKFSDDFFLYAEIIPNIYYQYSKNVTDNTNPDYGDSHQENSTSSFGISNLSNSGAGLTLVYRITPTVDK